MGGFFQDYHLRLIMESARVGAVAGLDQAIWEALAAGAVPVYWGARHFSDWLPDPIAGIDASEYSTSLHLAAALQELERTLREDQHALVQHHDWRKQPVMCESGSSFCRALAAQVPRNLSWDALVTVSRARLKQGAGETVRGYLRPLLGDRCDPSVELCRDNLEVDTSWNRWCQGRRLTQTFAKLRRRRGRASAGRRAEQ